MKYNRLTLIKLSHKDNWGKQYWLCECDCGNIKTYRLSHIKQGRTKSCGCLNAEQRINGATHGHARGDKASRTYVSYQHIKARCNNPKHKQYPDYGGRGITVCDRWLESFENFLADMGECPDGLTIERLDNDLGYSPDNCIWADMVAQANNRRSSRIIKFDGKSLTIAEWSRETGIKHGTISWRLAQGWSVHDALFLALEPNTFTRHSERNV